MSKAILPKNVREADAQLEELRKQMAGQGKEPPKGSEPPITPEETPPEPTKTTPEPNPPHNEPPKDPDENTYKQKYSVLQGKYNKEVPRLQGELKAMQAQIEEVNKKYASLLESQKTNPPPTNVTKADVALLSKIREEYGDNLAEGIDAIVEAKAAEMASKLFQDWEAKANDRFGKFEQSSAQARQNSFFGDLTKACPDWKAIVKSEDWNDWLGNEDDDGETFQAKVDKAMSDFNVKTVSYVLGKFKALMGRDTAPSLADMAAPSKTTNTPPSETKKEIISGSEIRIFEIKRGQGRFRGKPTEEKQLSDKYDLALREGRVDFSK